MEEQPGLLTQASLLPPVRVGAGTVQQVGRGRQSYGHKSKRLESVVSVGIQFVGSPYPITDWVHPGDSAPLLLGHELLPLDISLCSSHRVGLCFLLCGGVGVVCVCVCVCVCERERERERKRESREDSPLIPLVLFLLCPFPRPAS